MIPIYINDKKEVLKYTTFDKEKATQYLEQFNKWHIENSLDSKIENERIVINL